MNDVTVQRRIEDQLTSHARLLESVEDAVVAVDQRFAVTMWSKGADELRARPTRAAAAARPESGWASLTIIERRVTDLVVQGLTNTQVAERPYVSRHTIDFHLRHTFRKLGVHSRTDLTHPASEDDHLR